MDLKNISVIVRKINRLYEIIENLEEASETEKDLFKAYILDLYEAVVISPDEISHEIDEETMLKQIKQKKKIDKKIRKQLAKNEAFLQGESDNADEEEAIEAHDNNQDVKEPMENENKDNDNAKPNENPIPPELLELFEFGGVAELSDKLSLKPVPDLTKAMGINEKIFTINELFGGNKEEFDNMLHALNGLNSFEEAKEVLIHSVASKHQWQKENKFKKAKSFIKLVHRRYN